LPIAVPRREQSVRVAPEHDGTDPIVRAAIDEVAHDRLCRFEARRPDIRRLHRAGHVEREDDLDAADLCRISGVNALRTCQAHDQERQRDGA
jgi:hypothetical protein